jgi:hypothetical protein
MCRCVQKLRQRIAQEAESLVTDSDYNAVESASGANGKQKGLTKRQDSFYTSRSIINLSGLSVADPAPITSDSINTSNVASTPLSAVDGDYGQILANTNSKPLFPACLSFAITWLIRTCVIAPATPVGLLSGKRPSFQLSHSATDLTSHNGIARKPSNADFGARSPIVKYVVRIPLILDN